MIAIDDAPPPERRHRWPRVLLALALLCAIVWGEGYLRWPTGPSAHEGFAAAGSPHGSRPGVFRVGTFNMHSAVGEDDVYNIRRPIDAVRDTDLCGLNEVRGWFFSPPGNQAEELATATSRRSLFAPTERRYWHDDFGNGILSRLAVRDYVVMPLPIEPRHSGRRNCILAHVDFGGKIVNVIVAHIDRERDQSNQLHFVTRLFDSLQPPALLLADLNAEAQNPDVQALLALPRVHDCLGEMGVEAAGSGRIDWIIGRGVSAIAGNKIQNGASDHPLYWVDLTLD